MIKGLYSAILDFLFPPRCPACLAYRDRPGQWCPDCLEKAIHCQKLPLRAEDQRCLHSVLAAGHYRGGMKRLIQQLKYQRKMTSRIYIESFLAAALARAELFPPDVVTPVPLFPARERQRGFNQAEVIFRPWVEKKQWQWCSLLCRRRATKPQYELSPYERRCNMKNAFALAEGHSLQGCNILLVDDIFTTGATMAACADVLKQAGARRIDGLVLASDSQ